MDNISRRLSQGNTMLRQTGNIVDQAGSLASSLGISGSGTNHQSAAGATLPPLPDQNAQSGSVLSGGVQEINGKRYFVNPAPKGTRLIIPAKISSTGQERYIGAHTLESIVNLHQGNPKCANVIVFGAGNKPSSAFYDFGPNGEIFLKGTNKQISFDEKDPPVKLSETEYISIVQSLNQKTNDVTYFKTNADLGEAENSKASSPSWFSQNWWKILLGLAIAGGLAWGGIAIYNKNRDKPSQKFSANTNSSSNSNQNSNVLDLGVHEEKAVATGLSAAQNITNASNEQQAYTNNNSNSM